MDTKATTLAPASILYDGYTGWKDALLESQVGVKKRTKEILEWDSVKHGVAEARSTPCDRSS